MGADHGAGIKVPSFSMVFKDPQNGFELLQFPYCHYALVTDVDFSS